MGWSKARITQDFTITVDHVDFFTKLAELIENQLDSESKDMEKVSVECEEIDGDVATFTGSYDSTVKTWHCSATMESPEEWDIEKPYVEEVLDLEDIIVKNARELAKMLKVDISEDEDAIDWHDDEWED